MGLLSRAGVNGPQLWSLTDVSHENYTRKKNIIRGPYADYTRECKNQHILIVLHCFCNTLARSDAQNAWNMIGICMEYVWNMREISWKVEPSSPPTSGPEWAQALRWRSQDQGTIRELYAKAFAFHAPLPQDHHPVQRKTPVAAS